MKLLFTGGGTLGSVMPLLAVLEELKLRDPGLDFLWVGTGKGPEKQIVETGGAHFKSIISTKLRRYFDARNFFAPFFIVLAFFQSFFLLRKERPSIVVSAGGFVGLPLIWAAWCQKIPILIHQEDAIPGLANRLAAPFAKKITVTFPKSADAYPKNKTAILGNPVRAEISGYSKQVGAEYFNLSSKLPVLFITGGGTGSDFLNNLLWENLDELTSIAEIIHSAGRGKAIPTISGNPRYHQYEILTDRYVDALALADLVVSRAGMSALSEFAAMSKPAFLIPLPGHQEENARILEEAGAAIVLKQKDATPKKFLEAVRDLLENAEKRAEFGKNIHQAIKTDVRAEMADLVLKNARV
jgi:UDP-N-acetylglucosamine--N-acetylmuramyl-(pentapeptide) pyrophosphoryl-undecaprenol N-acetylglucosamine transferase